MLNAKGWAKQVDFRERDVPLGYDKRSISAARVANLAASKLRDGLARTLPRTRRAVLDTRRAMLREWGEVTARAPDVRGGANSRSWRFLAGAPCENRRQLERKRSLDGR